MAQVGQNADTLTRVLDNEGDSFGAIVRRGDCVDGNILKRDRAASSKEPNFVHLSGFEILRNMSEPNAPELYDESMLDHKMSMIPEEAERYTRLLAQKEGLFVGISSGAALSGAIRVAATLQSGVIVVILPDRGEKYLSTNVFKSQSPAESKLEPELSLDYMI